MAEDFLRELELLGVPARLKRLSDALSAGIKELYRVNELDIEPSWHLVFLSLSRREATVSEIAAALRLSPPAMTKMIERMLARGYLETRADAADGRRKKVRLTARARERLPEFERVWAAGEAAVGEVLAGNERFLEEIGALEDQLASRTFAERALARLGRDRGAGGRGPRSPGATRPEESREGGKQWS